MSGESERARAIRELVNDGTPRRALPFLESSAPESWVDASEVIEAARLLGALGALGRASRLVLRRWRRARTDPFLVFAASVERLNRRGPFHAWLALRDVVDPPEGMLAFRYADLRINIATALADYATAEQQLQRLRALGAGESFVAEAHAQILRSQDRREAALDLVLDALARAPRSVWLIDNALDLLDELGRAEESLALLREKEALLDCAPLSMRLCEVLLEREDDEGAEQAVLRAEERFVLAEPTLVRAIAGMRCRLAYRFGRWSEAVRYGRASELPPFLTLADALEKDPLRKLARKTLPVRHVAQHQSTCVPATLTALFGFEGVQVAQGEIADAICFDGTAAHAERAWAEERGFVVREFTLSFETAVALVDAGVAFSLVLVDAVSAHMVAVVGYDLRIRTLLLMDPARTGQVEVLADKLIDAMAPYGPRASLVLSPNKLEAVRGIALADAELYDELHAVHRQLDREEVTAAERGCQSIESKAPGARLALWAQRALALHRRDFAGVARLSEELLERNPGDLRSRVLLAECIVQTTPRVERRAHLRKLLDGAGGALAALTRIMAEDLASDAREVRAALLMARRSLRASPMDARAMAVIGRCAMLQMRWKDARDIFRIVSALDFANEAFARTYFEAARRAGTAREAIQHLLARAARWRSRSATPSITVIGVLEMVGRYREAEEELERVVAMRGRDPTLLAFAAETYCRTGRDRRARACLDELEAKLGGNGWLAQQAKADLAIREGRVDNALTSLEAAARERPDDLSLPARIAEILGASRGWRDRAAFSERTIASASRPSIDSRLTVLLSPKKRRSLARRVLEHDSTSFAAHCELIEALLQMGDPAGAGRAADELRAIAPSHPQPLVFAARAAFATRDYTGARRDLRKAYAFDVDHPEVIDRLIALSEDQAKHDRLLGAILRLALARSTNGNALRGWYANARGATPFRALERAGARMRLKRPDLPDAWILSIEIAVSAGQFREAAKSAEEGLSLHVGHTGVLMASAEALRCAGEERRARALLHEAHSTDPGLSTTLALCRLSDNQGRTHVALKRAQVALRRQPTAVALLHRVASALATTDRERARGLIDVALKIAPRAQELWALRVELAGSDGIEPVLEAASAWANDRDWDPEPSLVAAWLHRVVGRAGAALPFARRAVALAPLSAEARRSVALTHLRLGDSAAALDACAKGGLPPLAGNVLSVHKAAIEAETGLRREAQRRLAKVSKAWPHFAPALRGTLELESRPMDGAPPSMERLGRAAANLLSVEPDEVRALVIRARLLHASGDGVKARRSLQRALLISPRDAEALDSAAGVEIALKSRPRARRLIERLEGVAPARGHARRVELELTTGTEGAKAVFDRVARDAAVDPEVLQAMIATWDARSPPNELSEYLDALAAWPESSDAFVRAWVAVRLERLGSASVPGFLKFAVGQSESHGAMVVSFVLEAHARRAGAPIFRWSLPYLRLARRNPTLWATIGLCLLARGWVWSSLVWSRDWSRRAGVEPWMLSNIAAAWRCVGFVDRAASAHRSALSLPADHTHDLHRVYVALDHAWHRRFDEAAVLRAQIGANAPAALPILDVVLARGRAVPSGSPTRYEALQALWEHEQTLIKSNQHSISVLATIARSRRAIRRFSSPHRRTLERISELGSTLTASRFRRGFWLFTFLTAILVLGVVRALMAPRSVTRTTSSQEIHVRPPVVQRTATPRPTTSFTFDPTVLPSARKP